MPATFRSEKDMKEQVKKKLDTTQDPMEKLRLQCLQRGCAGIKELGRMFRIIDDDGGRSLSMDEFIKGCHDFGATLGKNELTALFKSMDVNDSGTIDFEEFLIALRPPMAKCRQDVVMMAFRKLDKTNDGVIKVDDLYNVYSVERNAKFISGEMTKEDIFKEFLKNFESGSHPDGIVTKEEFLNYYSGVSASIDNDMYFDLMMRNAWKLT